MIQANLAVTLRLRPIYTPIWPNQKSTKPQHALMHPPITPLRVSQKPVMFQDTANEITPIQYTRISHYAPKLRFNYAPSLQLL